MAQSGGKRQVAAIDGFFTWPSDDPHLIGSKCKSCGTYYFPRTFTCENPDCKGKEVEDVLLNKRGKLYSYTISYYPAPPPSFTPDPFVPYGIGLVELPEGIRVLGVLTDCDLDTLRIDTEMELVMEKLDDDEQNEYMGWKFRPA